jgi:hypothetical protein
MSTRAAELNARGDPGRARRGRPQAQRPAPKDARLPDPRRATHQADRRAPHGHPRALTSLRPTAFARQRPDRTRRCGTSGVVHRPLEVKAETAHLADDRIHPSATTSRTIELATPRSRRSPAPDDRSATNAIVPVDIRRSLAELRGRRVALRNPGSGPHPAGLPGPRLRSLARRTGASNAASGADTHRRKTAHPGPSPADEWTLSGTEHSLNHSAGSLQRAG